LLKNRTYFLEKEVIDLGCGFMPYKKLLKKIGIGKYIGVDNYEPLKPDVVAENWNIGIASESTDVVLSTYSLEHTLKFNETINEIFRVLRRGGKAVLIVPFCQHEHGEPDDYYRFTQYYYKSEYFLSNRFRLLKIEPSNGYMYSIMYLIIDLFKSVPTNRIGRYVNMPLFVLCNSVGIIMDGLFSIIKNKKFKLLYNSLPNSYLIILEKI